MCQNSLEALQHGGNVEIGVANGGDMSAAGEHETRIYVRDDGPGLKPEERRHVFDPFYSARQAGRGLGLGLSKAWRIVASHGGRIEVESQPSHGATFTIILRRAGAAA